MPQREGHVNPRYLQLLPKFTIASVTIFTDGHSCAVRYLVSSMVNKQPPKIVVSNNFASLKKVGTTSVQP